MVGRLSKSHDQIFETLVRSRGTFDSLPRYSAVQSGLHALCRLKKRTEPPKETANEHMAIFLRMVVALAGLDEIAFALYYLTI